MNKDRYKVRNWQAYNIGLKHRGSITLWLSESAQSEWKAATKTISRGRPRLYSDISIITCLTIRKVFHLGLRQCEGFIASLFKSMKLDLPVPDYTILCRRAAKLAIQLPVHRPSGPIDIVVDSTGLKVYGEGEWKVRKHGAGKHRTWMKLHLAIDSSNQQVQACELTTNAVDDAEVVEGLLTAIGPAIDSFTGDGAYDKTKVRKPLYGATIKQIIPPQHNAVQSKGDKDFLRSRDEAVSTIKAKGRKEWKVEVGYHKRSLAETAMFRYKTIIGAGLQSRKLENQKAEAIISCTIINQMLQLIKPISIKIN